MKRFFYSFLALLWMISTLHFPSISASSIYYVSSSGSDSASGSESNPFKTINYAHQIAKDDDTIIILDEGIVLDETNNDAPFIIDKRLTFQGKYQNANLIVRAGGILLGADVTFKDMTIGTAGFLRPGIAANGHHLVLNNVSQNNTLRPLQIYGGTFANYNGEVYGQNVCGDLSTIEINDGNYDALYAGSINTTNTIPVQMKITKTNSLSLPSIYIASTFKNPLDTSSAGQIPIIADTILTNQVDIQLNNATLRTIAGIHEDNHISLSVISNNYYTPTIHYIDSLTIESSVIAPKGSLEQTNVFLNGTEAKKAVLDCTYLTTNQLNTLSSNEYGMLILSKNLPLAIQNFATNNPIEVRLEGGMPYANQENCGYSGYIDYDTTLIRVENTSLGSFEIINPYPTQPDLCCVQEDKSWISYDGSFGLPIRIVQFETFSQATTTEIINQVYDGFGGFDFNLLVQYHPDEFLTDLSFIPITYQITYISEDETITYPKQTSILNEDGYYICNYQVNAQTLMKLEAYGNSINICKGQNDILAGTYQIEMSMQTTSGIQSKTTTLQVVDELEIANLQSLQVQTDKNQYNYGEKLSFTFDIYPLDEINNGKIYIYNDMHLIHTIDIQNTSTYHFPLNQTNRFEEGLYDLYFVYQTDNHSVTLFDNLQIEVLAPTLKSVENLHANQINYQTIALHWDAVENAVSYDIYQKTNNDFILIDTSSTSSLTISKLKTSKTYQYYVVAKNNEKEAEPSETISIQTQLEGTVQLAIEQTTNTSFTLHWNQIEGATRYIIYRKYNDKAYQKVYTLGKDTFTYTTSSLPAGTYHFIVKAGRYDSTDRVMSDNSNEVSGIAHYEAPILSASLQNNQCLLNWNKLDGIQYYQIYRASSLNGTYRLLKTMKHHSCDTTYRSHYYYKVRGYRIYQDTKIYTPFSNIANI